MRTTFFGLLALTITACGTPSSTDAGTDVAHTTDAPTTSDVATDTTTSDTTTLDVPADSPVADDVTTSDAADVTTVVDVATDTPSDVPVGDAPCTRPTTDTGTIGTTCTAGRDTCPAGYTCQVHSGIVATYNCQITCRTDCECPTTLSCQSIVDKSGSHGECH